MTAHCLFEQSGTFRDAFRELGVPALDYDIRNDYGKTDVQIDLFQEIAQAMENEAHSGQMSLFNPLPPPTRVKTIFDNIQHDDIVMAFFPCTYFMGYDSLCSRCDSPSVSGYSLYDKMQYTIQRDEYRHRNYTRLSQLVMIACKAGFRLIIENPANNRLRIIWPLKAALIDGDRREDGDWYRKPTQYFFVNCEPLNNEITDKLEPVEEKNIEGADKRWERSEIHPQYARRFIKRHILGAQFQDDRQTV